MSPPHITARAFYGLRTDIRKNANYVTDSEIFYPAGGVLVLHDHVQRHQSFIRLPEKHISIFSISISPNKQYIALSQRAESPGTKPLIVIYDLQTMKRKKGLNIPFEGTECKEFIAVEFTWDSEYIVAITGEPDWMLYYYKWESGKIESQTKAQNPNGTGTVSQVCCNPTDATLVVVTGPCTFRLMNVSETVWRQWGWTKAENIIITSAMWLTPDRVMFGTKTGALMTVENGELRQSCIYRAADVTEVNLKKDELTAPTEGPPQPKPDSHESVIEDEQQEVRCMTIFAKGFAYACLSGLVHMFEKETPQKWIKRNVFRILDDEFRIAEGTYVDLNIIQHISVSPNQDSLLVSTLKSQLYVVPLFQQSIDQLTEIPFKELGPLLHHSRINGLTMCSWKPIFMTSGQFDRSIRLWNYETEDLELVKYYQEDIHSIALHPTGLFAIIGFSDKLRYVVILIDDLHQMREFPIRNCKVCSFSNNGHLFAAVNGSVIQIFSAVTFINIFNLKGHIAIITSLSWTETDDKLVSCGSEGAVYEWCMTTAKRIGEIIMKGHEFTDCDVSSDGKSSYVVGTDGEVKEVCNNLIKRNVKIIGVKLDTIVLARSDMMLFVTGGLGNVVSIQCPLLDKAVFAEFHMHNKNVTSMALSYDDQTLITVCEDATMCIWKLTNFEGKAIALDKDFAHSREILINKNDLQDKIALIKVLSTRINEMETEHAYQMRQVKALNADNIRDIHSEYCVAIEELKEKYEQMEGEHSHEINVIHDDIGKMQFDHARDLENAQADFNIRLIGEYNKYQALEDKSASIRSDYEQRLEDLAQSKRLALRELTDSYETQLAEKIDAIEELEEKIALELKEHEYIKNSIENDADREIIEIKATYEGQLKDEKDANVRLRGEAGVLKKKMVMAQKDIEELKHHVFLLKAEHKQYQTVIQGLEKDITDLQKEISERDSSIQEKEKRIHDLIIKNQELEKYKFVLNFKINELKSQIEPKENQIKDLWVQIEDMEREENKLLRIKYELEFKLGIMNEKLLAANLENDRELEKNVGLQHVIKKIQTDLFNLSFIIQDPHKLKSSIKILLKQKYMADADFTKEKAAEQEAVDEVGRQRDHLERRIAALNEQLRVASSGTKDEAFKIMEENTVLLAEINNLRGALKEATTLCSNMKTLLGLSANRMTPTQARAVLQKACVDHDKLKEEFNTKIQQLEVLVKSLEDENQRLLVKIQCLHDSAKQDTD